MKITASRFPWQRRKSIDVLSDPKTEAIGTRYGWRGTPGMGWFGGGWNWQIGITVGGSTVMLNLVIGTVRIVWK